MIFYYSLTLCLFLQFVIDIFSIISRYPECGRYTANFSVIHKGSYFEGQISKVIKNATLRDCILHCGFRLECVFFNFKSDNTRCELIGSHAGRLTRNSRWEVHSTVYSLDNYYKQGPMCRYVNAKCRWGTEYCDDTCDAPGFRCLPQKNIAKGKKVTSSSDLSAQHHAPGSLVDGNLDTVWHSLKLVLNWFSVDLGKGYLIPTVSLVNVVGATMWKRSVDLTIRIGDNDGDKLEENAICAEGYDMSKGRSRRVFCEKPLVGRYVSVRREVASGNHYIGFAEIYVYAF